MPAFLDILFVLVLAATVALNLAADWMEQKNAAFRLAAQPAPRRSVAGPLAVFPFGGLSGCVKHGDDVCFLAHLEALTCTSHPVNAPPWTGWSNGAAKT